VTAADRFDIPLEELERTAHVPAEDLVMEQGEPPPPPPMSEGDLARQRLLGITAAGRLKD
jgi:hypothetical protein